MKYQETGFRALYHNYAVFPIDPVKDAVKDFPAYDQADCMLVYGYIDHVAGLSLEVLALGKTNEEGYRFFDGRPDARVFIRIGAVKEMEFSLLERDDLDDRFRDKIRMLDEYERNADLTESRKLPFLDKYRHDECVDDVRVFFIKEGIETELCWARIERLQKPMIVARLLSEPHQGFGVRAGDEFSFQAKTDENNETYLIADLSSVVRYTAEMLEDGTLLKAAIHKCNEEWTSANLLEVASLLRDSNVWIPCNAILSEADQKAFEEAVLSVGDDLESLKGMTLSNQDHIRMVPDILQNGEDFFFPAFTSCEEMGEYGNGFSKLSRSFLETIAMARGNEKGVKGVVINAFSEPFVIDCELFEAIESMNSRLAEQETDPAEEARDE